MLKVKEILMDEELIKINKENHALLLAKNEALSIVTYREDLLKLLNIQVGDVLNITKDYLNINNLIYKKISDSEVERLCTKMYKGNKELYVKLTKLYEEMGKSLTERFGFKIEVTNNTSIGFGIDIIKPLFDNKLITAVSTKANKNFINKKIISTKSDKRKKVLESVIKDIENSILKDKLVIDKEKLFVEGLTDTVIYIKINPVQLLRAELSEKEVTSLILGRVVTFINELTLIGSIYTKTDEYLSLLNSSLSNEKVGDIDRLQIVYSGITKKSSNGKTKYKLISDITNEVLNELKRDVTNYNYTESTILLDLAKLNYDTYFTKAVYLVELDKGGDNKFINSNNNIFISSIKNTVVALVTMLSLIIGVGFILIPALYLTSKVISLFFGIINYFLDLIFVKVFGDKSLDANADYIKNLKLTKRANIKLLRVGDLTRDERNIIIAKIDNIDNYLSLYENTLKFYRETKTDRENISELLDALTNNDLFNIADKIKF